MCILALVSGHSTRWPFIFMHNRDEFVSRLTRPLAVDDDEGILWARDASIPEGGSWLGVNVRSGAFAALTNCRRAPTTIRDVPFEEIARRSHREAHNGQIMFHPDASRGVLVRDYLRNRSLPPSCPWAFPMLDGYNLLAAPDLLCEGAVDLQFYTNRYTEVHGQPVRSGQVHVLANSTMDNPHEPKSMYLRHAVERWLETSETGAGGGGEDLGSATDVADACGALLGAQNGFEQFDEELLLDASKPFLGIQQEQMSQLLARPCDLVADAKWFTGNWSRETERLLHRDVFVTACGPNYRTRTQSVVLVEHDPVAGKKTLHVLMRETHGPQNADPWMHHTVTRNAR